MQRLTQISLLLLIMLMIAGCGEKKEIVAKVGRESITLDEFKDAFLTRFRSEDNVLQRSFNDRKDFVKTMAVSLAKYQEGLARGYDKDPEITDQLENVAKRLSLDYLYREKVTNVVVTEEMLKDFYDKSAKEVRARHILIKSMPADTTDEAEARLRSRIDSIQTLIVNGMDFGEAAVKFSEDGTTAPDSGDLEWFPWGRMVGKFQEAAWEMKAGEITDPVRTPYGFHLIQVTDTRDINNRPSYADMKEQLKAQLRNQEGERLGQRARDYVQSLTEANNLEINDEGLTEFRERLQDPTVPNKQELAPLFTAEQKAMVAATFKGGSITNADLIEKVGGNAHRVDWKDPQVAIDLVHSLVEPKLLEEVAQREGFLKRAMQDPGYLEQKRNSIVRKLEQTEITNKINPTEAEERAYYEANLDQFIISERRTIREIFIKEDSSKAVRVRSRALKGENFERLARQFNEKESTKPDTGRIGPFEKKRFGIIGKTAFRLEKVGDISDVVKIGKNFSVVQLMEILPSRTQTWDESKSQAKREYRVTETTRLQDALDKLVLEKFKLEIFEDKLASAWPLKKEENLSREP